MKLPRSYHLASSVLAGQILMPAVHIEFMNKKGALARQVVRSIQKFQPGGIILFGGHPSDIQYWVRQFQEVSTYPLLVGADLERGTGGLFKSGTVLPHALAWGAADNLNLVREAATVIAREAMVLGINTVFAPVLDLVIESENPIINIRGFHSKPEKVAEIGKVFIETIQENGLACVAKHFPGHGRTSQDSHLVLPKINLTPEELRQSDIRPFKEAVKSGIKGIMSAHIQVKEKKLPVTLDPDILNQELRTELSYLGLIFSDALNMQAVSAHYTILEQITYGLNAGLDVFLMPEKLSFFHTLLTELIEKDDKLKSSAQESVERIFSLKKWIHRMQPEPAPHARIYKILEMPAHLAISHNLADASVTCIHKTNEFPLDLTKIKKCAHIIFTDFQPIDEPLNLLRKKLSQFFDEVQTQVNQFDDVSKNNSDLNSDIFIISLYSRTFAGHVSSFDWMLINRTIKNLFQQKKPVILNVFGNPFITKKIKRLTDCAAVFLFYSYVDSSQAAAFNALCSFIPVQGDLPVSLGPELKNISIPQKSYAVSLGDKQISDFPKLDDFIRQSIEKKVFPGAVLFILKEGMAIYNKAYGHFDYDPQSPKAGVDTQYDLASLTKVLATTPAVLLLMENNLISLDDKLASFYLELINKPLGRATIRDLLGHQSGLPAWKPFYDSCQDRAEVILQILQTELEYKVGEKSIYSDLGFILLGDIIERVSGLMLDYFCRDKIFQPMGLNNLNFLPSSFNQRETKGKSRSRYLKIPPTGFDKFRNRIIHREVNDTNCYIMGGIAGHAGLFGNAQDVSAIAQLFLQKGIFNKTRIFKYRTADIAIKKVNPELSERAMGWDMPSRNSTSGRYLSRESFGHLAFTGPSIWADPEKNLVITFLCNRSHPDPENNQMDNFRPRMHDLVIEALKNLKL
jgi:beta-N-acetylhexosaminidase